MNTKIALVTALIVGSSTAAMADSSFTFRAHASASFGTPSYSTVSYGNVTNGPIVRDHRVVTERAPYDRTPYDRNLDRPYTLQPAPMPTSYLVGGVDCRNWDPMTDTSSACMVFETTSPQLISNMQYSASDRFNPWVTLGSRESSVPDIEYITVERPLRSLRIEAISGRPAITSVGIKFMDGTWQTANLGQLSRGGVQINVQGNGRRTVSQIVFHTANGSFGAYQVSAL